MTLQNSLTCVKWPKFHDIFSKFPDFSSLNWRKILFFPRHVATLYLCTVFFHWNQTITLPSCKLHSRGLLRFTDSNFITLLWHLWRYWCHRQRLGRKRHDASPVSGRVKEKMKPVTKVIDSSYLSELLVLNRHLCLKISKNQFEIITCNIWIAMFLCWAIEHCIPQFSIINCSLFIPAIETIKYMYFYRWF